MPRMQSLSLIEKMGPIIQGLNPPQREAVLTTEGPVLVLAGAGSGKTRVITCRIAHLLSRNVAPERILAVSFTNKAAGEMRERVTGMVGKIGSGCVLSTFHALGVRFLREEHAAAGLTAGFTILDEGDQVDAARTALRTLGYAIDQYEPRQVHQRISHFKNLLSMPGPVSEHPLDPVVARVMPLYQQRLKAMNAVDFDDLIGLPVVMLEKQADVAERWSHRFRYIMVDEYQDTNGAQIRLLRALCKGSGNLCVVGDDDQSIYAWRGAVAGNILKFGEQFPGAKIIPLTQNYRSTNAILKCANAVIANNAERHEKSLWSQNGEGERVRFHVADNDEAEAFWVATDLLRQKHARGMKWREFGVLYRTNAQSRTIEDEIRKAGIPYRIVGGTKFYDRKEIRDVVAWLRAVANPFDEAAWRRVVNVPQRGVGDASIEKLGEYAKAHATPFWRVVEHCELVAGIPTRVQAALKEVHALITEYRGRFRTEPLGEVSRAMIEDKRIGFGDECVRASKDARETQRRIENIREIPSALVSFQTREPDGKLEDFLARLALDTRKSDGEDGDEAKDEVSLMTLHGAKGLEFDVVFLLGMEEGLLPHGRVMAEGGAGDQDVAEERRLAYVGITRARKVLTMSASRVRLKYGKIERRKLSRFLYEIPEALLDGGYGGGAGESIVETPEQQHARVLDAFDALSKMLG